MAFRLRRSTERGDSSRNNGNASTTTTTTTNPTTVKQRRGKNKKNNYSTTTNSNCTKEVCCKLFLVIIIICISWTQYFWTNPTQDMMYTQYTDSLREFYERAAIQIESKMVSFALNTTNATINIVPSQNNVQSLEGAGMISDSNDPKDATETQAEMDNGTIHSQRDFVPVKPITTKGGVHWATVEERARVKRRAAEALLLQSNPTVVPDPPIQLLRLYDPTLPTYQSNTNPIVAIITSTRSTSKPKTVLTTMLWMYLIKSIINTVTPSERREWSVRLYIAMDDIDAWWLHHYIELKKEIPDWLLVTFGVYKKRNHHIPFNEMAYTAYQENATYYCRVNDDTQFLTDQWITQAVSQLLSYDPPNIGVTGPLCQQGNNIILTHDFVHRNHMEIFQKMYYPLVFNNWYLDDWISYVYSSTMMGPNFHRFQVLSTWKVKHWVFQQRYHTDTTDAQWLPTEYERGRIAIKQYLAQHYPGYENKVIDSIPAPQKMEAHLVDAIQSVLIPNGNLLVWAVDIDSPYWHRATSGRVAFLDDRLMKRTMEATAAHPYMEVYRIKHDAVERGSRVALDNNYMQYVQNQTFERNQWCDLEISLFPKDVQNTFWDVVIVDAPVEAFGVMAGIYEYGPGVFQSLYMTQRLVAKQAAMANTTTKQVHIFLNHYERKYEKDFAPLLLDKEPQEVLVTNNNQQEVAHFVVDQNDRITKDIPFCESPPIREESLFNDKTWASRHISIIFEALPRKGNLLVWGVQDCKAWQNVTYTTVVFLDDANAESTTSLKSCRNATVHRLLYETKNTAVEGKKYIGKSDQWPSLKMQQDPNHFPEYLLEIPWDVIVVDGPNFSLGADPGKFQSLYMSSLLAQNSVEKLGHPLTHIFVRNFDQNIVSEFSKQVFGRDPIRVIDAKRMAMPVKRIVLGQFVVGDTVAIAKYNDKVLQSKSTGLVNWTMLDANHASPLSPIKSPSSWVVLLQVSSGYYDIFLNWLFYFNKLELGLEVVVIAEDDPIYNKLVTEVLPIVTYLVIKRSDLDLGDSVQAFDYGTGDFKRIVATRMLHIQKLLEQKKSVISVDVDTVWRSSPLPYLGAAGGDVDIIAHVDTEELDGLRPYYGTGFIAFASNERVLQFVTQLAEKTDPANLFQGIFNTMLHMIGFIRHQPLPSLEFPSGNNYFTSDYVHKETAVVVHNNYVLGHDNKKRRFEQSKLWNPLPVSLSSSR